jgi:hypothetical protein
MGRLEPCLKILDLGRNRWQWQKRHHDIQHNDIRQNYTQHNNKSNMTLSIMPLSIMPSIMPLRIMTLSIMPLSIMVDICYAEWHLCWVSIMPSVANTLNMLNVIMLSVVMLNVIMLSVINNSLCWMSLCWVSLCWMSLCRVSLSWMSLCWLSWRHKGTCIQQCSVYHSCKKFNRTGPGAVQIFERLRQNLFSFKLVNFFLSKIIFEWISLHILWP